MTDTSGRINVRLDPAVHDNLKAAAKAHGHSLNYMVNYAVRDFLARLLDPADVKLIANGTKKAETPFRPPGFRGLSTERIK